MYVTLRQKRQAVLATLAADVAMPTAVISVPAMVVKAIPSAPMLGAVVGAPAAVVAVPVAAVSVAVAAATVLLLPL